MRFLPLLAALLLTAPAIAVTTMPLNELFSVEEDPGTGSLVYKQGDKKETIAFGKETGHYGLGMIFKGSSLPEPYSKDLVGNEILQIALGTARAKLQYQVPQFGSATIVMKGKPKDTATYPLMVPNGGAQVKKLALLLFTSPATPNEQSDEEKLKGTFFAQAGSVTVQPKGAEKIIGVRYQGKNVNFKTQKMVIDFRAKLVTPFNSQDSSLEGKVELPVYRPHGKEAQRLLGKMVGDSFGGMSPLPTSDALSTHPRDVAGSNKSDLPPKQKK